MDWSATFCNLPDDHEVFNTSFILRDLGSYTSNLNGRSPAFKLNDTNWIVSDEEYFVDKVCGSAVDHNSLVIRDMSADEFLSYRVTIPVGRGMTMLRDDSLLPGHALAPPVVRLQRELYPRIGHGSFSLFLEDVIVEHTWAHYSLREHSDSPTMNWSQTKLDLEKSWIKRDHLDTSIAPADYNSLAAPYYEEAIVNRDFIHKLLTSVFGDPRLIDIPTTSILENLSFGSW